MGAIAGIDHVILGVRDLEAARQTWRRLGFALSPRGRHIGQPTGNYCVMFPSDYIELLGIVEPGESGHRLENFLAWHEGLMGLALAPIGSAEDTRSALSLRGLHPDEPRALAREIELPEGTALARFSLVTLPPEDTPGLDCFLCGHLTPELMRRPQWLEHPNGATGLKAVHVLVESTTGLLAAYDRLFGIAQVTTTDAVASVRAGRHRLVFSTPDDFQTMYPGLEIDRDFRLPGIVALELAITRRDTAAAYLARQQVAFDEMPNGGLVVAAREASGAILFLSEG